jgi:hypothetical protein
LTLRRDIAARPAFLKLECSGFYARRGQFATPSLGEGHGVSAFEVIEYMRTPALYALWRAWFALAAAGRLLMLAFAGVRAGLHAAAEDLAAVHFHIRQTQYAIRDRLAAVRERLPATPNLPASTMIAYAAVGIMAAILADDLIGPTPANSSVTPVPERRPEWVEIARPHGAFALESPSVAALDSRYLVRRHRSGGGRKDELTFGTATGRGAYMRVSIYRAGTEGMAEPDPLEAVVALAADSGIDAEIQETNGKVKTKFGALPIVAMTVAGRTPQRACIATAGAWSDPRFGLIAWWCNDGPEMVAQGEFACLLDRIALMSAGGDDQLAEFFARAELKRNYCNVQGSFVSPTPHRPDDWIYEKRKPQLRGKLTAR